MPHVTFFTKTECGLCRSALFVIERVRRERPFELEIVDITAPGRETWLELYREHIPVVHLNGREIFRHRVADGRFRELLATAS